MSKTNSKTNMENQLRKPTTGAEAAKATAVPTKSPRPAGPCCARMVAAPVYLTHFTVSFEKLRHLNCCCYSIVGINNEWNRKLVARAATGSATGLHRQLATGKGILYFNRAQEIALPELLTGRADNTKRHSHSE